MNQKGITGRLSTVNNDLHDRLSMVMAPELHDQLMDFQDLYDADSYYGSGQFNGEKSAD